MFGLWVVELSVGVFAGLYSCLHMERPVLKI